MINDFKTALLLKKLWRFLKVDDYYEDRWEYYTEIINQLKTFEDIHSVFEFGPYKLPFVKESDIIDVVDDYKDDFPFEIGNFIVHDCSQLPLPIEDNKHDLVLACQVIEHLGLYGEQIELFKELERISKKVILISLPHCLNKEKQSLELENQKLLKEINVLKNTASWKVTKPLRDVKNKLR